MTEAGNMVNKTDLSETSKESNKVQIKIEDKPYLFVPNQVGKQSDIFICIKDFSETIHTD